MHVVTNACMWSPVEQVRVTPLPIPPIPSEERGEAGDMRPVSHPCTVSYEPRPVRQRQQLTIEIAISVIVLNFSSKNST